MTGRDVACYVSRVHTGDKSFVQQVSLKLLLEFRPGNIVELGGSLQQLAQFRFEILNLTNTVKVRGPEQRLGQGTFGDILEQSGFMRITQLTFRLTF